MTTVTVPETLPKPNFKKDIKSILLLFLLYILQGVPLGLISTIPFLLQSQGVLYKDQAKFSLAFWPFSLKVLYAPVIDAIYWKRLGRRKSWLIPLQYLISIFLLVLSFQVDDLFTTKNVRALTTMFFILNFLAASQDVAVDGWALTMLSPENVGYASACNAVGQMLGWVFGYSVFLALDSASFANNFRPEPLDHGFVTLPSFLLFWALVFAVTTTLILIFKKEKKESPEVTAQHMKIFASYQNLWKILKLRNIQILIAFFLTVKIGTAATDSLTRLKLVEVGVPKETLAFYSVPLIPIKLLIPLIASKWIVGSSPMKLYINAIPFSLLFAIIWPIVVFWLPSFKSGNEYTIWTYVFLFVIIAIELVPNYVRFVASMAFAAKISDPAVGGTYMTLINTVNNVGGTWPVTFALWLVDYVQIPLRDCPGVLGAEIGSMNSSSNSYDEPYLSNIMSTVTYHPEELQLDNLTMTDSTSTSLLQNCIAKIDGYYVETVVFVTIGSLWLIWGRPTILRLQQRPRNTWKIL